MSAPTNVGTTPGTTLPPPPLSTSAPPRYAKGRKGFAEVKPHNVRGVLAGLRSLRDRQARAPLPQAFLLTYRHSLGEPVPRSVTPYLLVPHGSVVTTPPRPPAAPDTVRWLGTLGQWFALSPVPLVLPAHAEPRWGRDIGPVVRGSIIEPLVRYAFFRFSDFARATDLTAGKQPHQAGADVAWQEIAEYLYELVSELGADG